MSGWPPRKDKHLHEVLSKGDHDETALALCLSREDAKRWRHLYLYGAGGGTAFFWMERTSSSDFGPSGTTG
jgi:hypothetical protein